MKMRPESSSQAFRRQNRHFRKGCQIRYQKELCQSEQLYSSRKIQSLQSQAICKIVDERSHRYIFVQLVHSLKLQQNPKITQQYAESSCLRPEGLQSQDVDGILLRVLSSAYQSLPTCSTKGVECESSSGYLGHIPFDKQLRGCDARLKGACGIGLFDREYSGEVRGWGEIMMAKRRALVCRRLRGGSGLRQRMEANQMEISGL